METDTPIRPILRALRPTKAGLVLTLSLVVALGVAALAAIPSSVHQQSGDTGVGVVSSWHRQVFVSLASSYTVVANVIVHRTGQYLVTATVPVRLSPNASGGVDCRARTSETEIDVQHFYADS